MAEMQENPETRHETSDVHPGGIVKFGIGLTTLLLVVLVVVAWLNGLFSGQNQKEQVSLTPLAKERPRLPQDLKSIPEPRLQKLEINDMEAMHKEEEELLNSYGWVDREAGMVRIPIKEAVDVLADPQKARRLGIAVRPQGVKKPGRDLPP